MPSTIEAQRSSSTTRQVRTTRQPPWLVESAGLLVAVSLAVVVVAHVAASNRSWILFSDGDSVLPALIRGSLAVGQPQAWSLSSVLFIPETALYLALSLLGASRHATLALNGVANLFLLFGALRMVAGIVLSSLPRNRQVLWASPAATVFTVLCLSERSGDRNGLELATLSTTTAYYFSTLLALVVLMALTARVLGGNVTAGGMHRRRWLVAICALTAGATWTNPLFLAWAVVPVVVIVVLLRRVTQVSLPHDSVRMVLAATLTSAGLGWALRLPVRQWISSDAAAKIQPWAAPESARFYWALLIERASTPAGIAELAAVATLVVLSGFATVLCVRRGTVRGTVIAASGWVVPLCVAGGAVLLGTQATRYLQPTVLLPIVALLAWPALLVRHTGTLTRFLGGAQVIALAVIVTCGIGATPGLIRHAETLDPSVHALDSWIETSGRVGVGQYWTIRAPKAYLADPRQLVQVDAAGNGYAWLTNNHDLDISAYSFVVVDNAAPAPAVPAGTRSPAAVLHFGRYTVLDYGAGTLPIGPSHH